MKSLLGGDLDRFTARHGLGQPLAATRIVRVASDLAAGRYRALSYRAGRLTIAVPTHAERYRIQTKLADIAQQLNTQLGRELIEKIVVRIQQPL